MHWTQFTTLLLSDFPACSFWVRTIVSNNKHFVNLISGIQGWPSSLMEPVSRKDKPKQRDSSTRGDRGKQKSAQQELKQRQRAEIYALNKVMTELEQQQFEAFCKRMQSQGDWQPAKQIQFQFNFLTAHCNMPAFKKKPQANMAVLQFPKCCFLMFVFVFCIWMSWIDWCSISSSPVYNHV